MPERVRSVHPPLFICTHTFTAAHTGHRLLGSPAMPMAIDPRCTDTPSISVYKDGPQGTKILWESGVAYCLSFPLATHVFFRDDGGYTEVYCYTSDPYSGPNPNAPCNQQCAAVTVNGAPSSYPCGDSRGSNANTGGDTGIVYTLVRPGPYSWVPPSP